MPEHPCQADAAALQRSRSLDIAKGVFVLAMILYHGLDVVRQAGGESGLTEGLRSRLGFLHYAFLLLSGYLCGWHYFPQTLIDRGQTMRTIRRLQARSANLLALWLSANVVLYLFAVGGTADAFREQLTSSASALPHLLLNMDGKNVAFEVLYFIAVFLFVASFTLGPKRTVVLCLLMAAMSWLEAGLLFRFLLVGSIGMGLGMLRAAGCLESAARGLRSAWVLAAPAALVLLLIIGPGVRAHLGHGTLAGLLVRVLETLVWCMTAAGILSRLRWRRLVDRVVMLGRHTLLGYVAGVILCRFGALTLPATGINPWMLYGVQTAACAVGLSGIVWVLARLQASGSRTYRAYRWVIG